VVKRYAVIFAVVAVLAAACGGATADTDSNDAASSQVAQSDQTETTAPQETTEAPKTASVDDIDLGEDGELSIDDFIPGIRSGPQTDADYRAQEMEIQQQIAECMAAEGFDYIPFVPADVGGGFGFEEEDHGEWVKKYGFGVSTWVLMEEEFAEGEGSDPWANDPNQEIVEAMDEFEMKEYYRLLHGGEPDIIANTPQEEIEAMTPEEQEKFFNEAYENWMPDGCYNEAYEEFYGGGEEDMAFWEEFGEDFEETYMRVEADPRIVEAQAGWSACMADKGHDFPTQQAMHEYFWGTEVGGEWVEGEFSLRVNELVTWPEPIWDEEFVEGEDAGSVVTTVVTEDGEGEFEYYGPEYDIELLQPLIDEEIAIAVADWECSKDLQDLFEKVYKEIEQQFLEENLDRLLAFKEEHA
jgi:hypothetical protein